MEASAGRLGETIEGRSATARVKRACVTAALLVLAGPCACRRLPTAGLAAADAGAPPSISWAGCAVVRVGPRCELGGSRKLTLWIPGEEGSQLTFAADGRALAPAAGSAMQEGWQLTLEIPAGTSRLTAARAGGVEIWSLAVGDARLFPEIDALVAAGKRGDADAAAKLRELCDGPDADMRAAASAGYGRVMLARGDTREAEPALRRALASHREAGRLSSEMRDGSTLIWALAEQQQRFADARAVLGSLTTAREQFPEGAAYYADNEALLAVETGDPRGALASYRTGARAWERLGRLDFTNDKLGDIAMVMAALGRYDEAVAIFDRLPPKDDACAQASLLINKVEALTQAAAHTRTVEALRVEAALAAEQRETSRCLDPRRRLLATIHAARWALATGDQKAADGFVKRLLVERGPRDTLLQALRAEMIGRWSLARGDGRAALVAFDEQAAIARAGGLRDESFRAEVGAGEALLALHLRPAAVRRLTAAQELQQRMFEDVPFAEGRGEFLSSHDEGARSLVDALVDDGAAAEAMVAARLARATEAHHAARLDRLSRLSSEQRRRWDEALARYASIRRAIEHDAIEEWKLPAAAVARARLDRERRAEEARTTLDAAYRLLVRGSTKSPRTFPLRADVVEISFFPGAKGKSWIGFARTTSGTVARRFSEEALANNGTASAVLEALSPQLQRARHVVLFPFGQSDTIDWQAVSWRSQPLIAKFTVEYRLDLPDPPEGQRVEDLGKRALVVADPSRDLASARREADLVEKALGGWKVTRLDGPAATRDALLASLPAADLFHYAGHAQVSGPSGATSALFLTGGARVEVGDLQALPHLPRVVLLSACEAAATPSTMGLAQAILAAGAKAVLAPTRVVGDADAQAFIAAFYDRMATGGLSELRGAYQHAALETIASDANSFRLLGQ
jgi:hypothetical protein